MIDWDDATTWHVLLVDDEPDNLEVVAETLEYNSVDVRTAANGKEALEALRTFDANLIVTDLSMPLMNGWEMRTRLKNDEAFASIPILALSAHAIAGDKERALEAGFDGYLTKPISVLTLIADIRSAVFKPVDNKEKTT